MDRILAFVDRHWNILAVIFFLAMVFCVLAKKLLGWFADIPVTPFAFYAALAVLSIPLRKISQIPEKYWYPISLGALAFPFFCFLFGSLGFLAGISLTKWHGVAALLTAVGILWKLSPEKKVFVVNLLVVVGLWLGCIGLASMSRNRDYDSFAYHKPGAILMAEGWNPVWQPDLEQYLAAKNYSPKDLRLSHAAFFPKGQWIIVGTTSLLTGIMDTGDYVNGMLMLVCILLFYALLKEWLKLSPGITMITAVGLALNPIAMGEMRSGMIDGNLGLCFLLFLLAAIVWQKTGDRKWIPLVLGSAIYGCTLKHNAPVFFGVVGMLYSLPIIWQYLKKRLVSSDRWAICGEGTICNSWAWWSVMGTIFVLVILCGWNPYVTNTWNHTSPFYPLHTFDEENHPKEDILRAWYTWDHFCEASPWQRFLFTHVILREGSISSAVQSVEDVCVDIKDVCFFPMDGQFLHWNIFPLLLIISSGFLFFIQKWDHWLVILAIIVTVAIHPHAWWDRFVPQMFAFPILILACLRSRAQEMSASCCSFRSRWLATTTFFLSLILLNNSLNFLHSIKGCAADTILEAKEIAILDSSPHVYTGKVAVGDFFKDISELHCYVRHFLDLYGFDEIEIESMPEGFCLEKDSLIKCGLILYHFPKEKRTSPQTEEDISLEYSDVEYSEFPKALRVVGKLRWKQFCKAWRLKEDSVF